jgi:ornithine decarboxylase
MTLAPSVTRLPAPRLPAPRRTPETPYLELDVDKAAAIVRRLREDLPVDALHYAVKANPHPALLRRLYDAGARFDVASPAEVRLCLEAGAHPHDLVYSHPVKRWDHIVEAVALGVDLFVVDDPQELLKLAHHAPGCRVLARLATSGEGADWPLSRKFGCPPDDAEALLRMAHRLGLRPTGLTFHVGSQQRSPGAWAAPIAQAGEVFRRLHRVGIELTLLDLGGGFPMSVDGPALPEPRRYGSAIRRMLARAFGRRLPWVIAEPGRAVAGDAGRVVSTVVEVVHRGDLRWVFVDVGVFSGMFEALDEAIRYRISTSRTGAPAACVLAGPTCDSMDVLYEREPALLPVDLVAGDTLVFESAGAYVTTNSTTGFNGFDPLPTRIVGGSPEQSRATTGG